MAKTKQFSRGTTCFFIGLIKIYQYFLSQFVGCHCRFYPTCSSYSIEAIKTHGNIGGCYLTLRRILRCHPWSPGGIDLVPEKKHAH